MPNVCFATFVLERGHGHDLPAVETELPYTWPEGAGR